ncbi:MAG: type II toxin-antitoxin system PemK/MazF family toxin [Pseudomonadota bacterium]
MDGVKRGDVVLIVAQGDFGKPRPAVVVQSDLFNDTHATVSVCPLTSTVVDAPMFRVSIEPAAENGLKKRSQAMVDKVQPLRRERIKERIGMLTNAEMQAIGAALKLWFSL